MSLNAFLPIQVNSDIRSGSFGSGWDGAEPGWAAWNLGGGPASANEDNSLGSFQFDATGYSGFSTSLITDERGSFEAQVEVRIYAVCPVAFTVIYHWEETPYEGGDPEHGDDITVTIGANGPVTIAIPVTFETYTRMIVTAIIAHPWN